MTKSLTMNNFTTETLTHDKKLIKQWRNATTQPIIYIFFFKNLQWQKISTKKKYLTNDTDDKSNIR